MFVVVFVWMRACRNRFILNYHADVIIYPVLTEHFYFLFLPASWSFQVRFFNIAFGQAEQFCLILVYANSFCTPLNCKTAGNFPCTTPNLFQIPPQSLLVFFVMFVVVFAVMRACHNRFILNYHADVILYPVLTAYVYFLSWISLSLSLEVFTVQSSTSFQVRYFNFYRHFSW